MAGCLDDLKEGDRVEHSEIHMAELLAVSKETGMVAGLEIASVAEKVDLKVPL